MSKFKGVWAVAVSALLLAGAAMAAPVTLTYEGDLRTDEGAQAQGMHNLTFALYERADGGDSVWTETHLDVLVVDGHLFADLGSMVAFDESLSRGEILYLGVSVDGDAEATPRMTVGGALRAQWASVAENARDVRGADIQPRSVAVAGGSTRLDDGTLRLGPEASQVLTAAALATLTGGGNADALHTHAGQVGAAPRFVGVTEAVFTGNLGGPIGANAKCSEEFAGAYMCNYCTVFQARLTQPLPRDAWLDYGYSCAGTAFSTDERTPAQNCWQWTSARADHQGSSVATTGRLNSQNNGGEHTCEVPHAIACCAD